MYHGEHCRVLSRLSTNVTDVIAFDPGRCPWTTNAKSSSPVFLDPPAVLTCVAYSARVFPTLSGSTTNTVSVVTREPSMNFATDIANPFCSTDATERTAAPLLLDASARCAGAMQDRVEADGHETLLDLDPKHSQSTVSPLVKCRGSFAAAPQPGPGQ